MTITVTTVPRQRWRKMHNRAVKVTMKKTGCRSIRITSMMIVAGIITTTATTDCARSMVRKNHVFYCFLAGISAFAQYTALEAEVKMVSIAFFDGCLGDVEISGIFYWLLCALVVNN
ncbi:hypothetical protein L6452_06074 [Arctium lappa]|uniref:Uncharacterized protein n=1 Tax=Arctium lappa TaxID=4217 RepID=A0ACB9EHV8_ARCLA|nr:hypothetical protein L6452_06074 [Arctium lappa]